MGDEEEQVHSSENTNLPSSLSVAKFVACRSQEIQIMKNSLAMQLRTKLAFQTLPKHMRRRAMSHNVKRLPRRLQQIHLNQMKKSGTPTKQKRPSRKHRRRPRNLTEEYIKRSRKKSRWLQTHIWHAKRFHMVEKWGYKLPHRPCDKAFRACYRAMTKHCLLQDISYFKCIEISGDKNVIIESLKQLSKPGVGRSVGAKSVVNGNYEGELTLFESTTSEKVIGTVNFQWRPIDCNASKLWLWIHAAFYDAVKTALTDCFTNKLNVTFQELDDHLARFRLTGPLSNSVLHDALTTINPSDKASSEYIEFFKNNKQVISEQHEYWNKIKNISSPSNLFPHFILGLIVQDPRLNIPKKRIKNMPELQNCEVYDIPNSVANSPLWDESNRKQANSNKMSDIQIADLHSNFLVPESDLIQANAVHIPIILIQKPGNKDGIVGLGSGWDVVLPTVWAKTFWTAFVMRGARAGGLRESNSILFEMGKSQLLQPDSKAGTEEALESLKENTENFFRKPPKKRTNYNKFKIATPFFCDWKLLAKEWDSNHCEDDVSVIRNRGMLVAIDSFLNSKVQSVPQCPKNSLVPVKLESEKRGNPLEFAIICLPKFKEDFNGISEPTCADKFQFERKKLRTAHKNYLKKLKKQRKRKKYFDLDMYKNILTSYTKKMRALWLPKATTIRNSCCREVAGYVTKGGFSFSLGKSSATGYITSSCLSQLAEFRNKVLFRNTTSRQYHIAKLSVILE